MKHFLTYLKACILPFLAAEAILIIVALIVSFLYQIFIGFQIGFVQGRLGLQNSAELVEKIRTAMSRDMIYLISFLAVIIWGVIFFFWYRHEIRGERRGSFRNAAAGRNMIFFLFLGVGCQLFFSGAMNLLQSVFYELFQSYGNMMGEMLGGNIIIVLLYTVIAAPIAEELVFRGVILHRAGRVIPFLGANILQALLFGLYHQNIVQGIYAAIVGFVLGLIYQKYNTIYASIILHMIINASAFPVMMLPDAAAGYIAMTIAGLMLIIYSFCKLKLWNYKKAADES